MTVELKRSLNQLGKRYKSLATSDSTPKFLVDGMLGSLAKKLRIFGFDTVYDTKMDDEEILQIAESEMRTVVTSDIGLFNVSSKKNVSCILLNEDSDNKRLTIIFRDFLGKPKLLNHHDSRCALCNGEVVRVDKEEVFGHVPDGVWNNQDEFFRCRSCMKIYWIGRHWQDLYELSNNIRQTLSTSLREV